MLLGIEIVNTCLVDAVYTELYHGHEGYSGFQVGAPRGQYCTFVIIKKGQGHRAHFHQ